MLLLLFLYLFRSEGAFTGGPNGKAFEADFAMFLTAAQVVHEGGNPYDHNLLYRKEKALLDREGLAITEHPEIVRVGNPPLLFWTLEPLVGSRFQPMALMWLALMYSLTLAGFVGLLHYLGWKRWLLPCLIFALMPPVFFGPFYGNIICLVFAGLGCALAVLKQYPVLAGALCSVAIIKPPVALPVVLLLLLFHPSQRKQMLAGFLAALAGIFMLTMLALGWHILPQWVQGLVGYSRDIHTSPDIASLSGLYVRVTGTAMRSVVGMACIGLALAVTAVWWWRHRHLKEPPLIDLALLSCVWFLAAPYAHFFDEVLLALPLLILMGRDGHRVTWGWPARALYLMFFSICVLSADPHGVQLLPIPLVAVTGCILIARFNSRYRTA